MLSASSYTEYCFNCTNKEFISTILSKHGCITYEPTMDDAVVTLLEYQVSNCSMITKLEITPQAFLIPLVY